jgi:ATP-dependent DNA helicase RecQ
MYANKKNDESIVAERNTENVREAAISIMKTVTLTGSRYGVRYILMLVRGDDQVAYRRAEHGSLETLGALHTWSASQVKELICHLIVKGLLYQSVGEFPVVRITQSGIQYLEMLQAGKVEEIRIRFFRNAEKVLFQRLQSLRAQMAEQFQVMPGEILSDASLYHLSQTKPLEANELLGVYGIGPWKLKRYGVQLQEVIQSFLEEEKLRAVTRMLKSVTRPTFQETKVLFEQGMEPTEIADFKGIKLRTVMNYLESLHLSGQIDLRNWIEKYVDRKTLHTAVQFFRDAHDNRIQVAHEVLGYDYDTLRLCRLYLSRKVALPQGQAA